MDTKSKITTGMSVLALLGIVTAFGLVGQPNVYVCEDLEIAMQCDDLSAINYDGLQTRCYFYSEEKQRDTYKKCSSGWKKFENEQAVPINVTGKSKYYICKRTKDSIIDECISNDGQRILRVG